MLTRHEMKNYVISQMDKLASLAIDDDDAYKNELWTKLSSYSLILDGVLSGDSPTSIVHHLKFTISGDFEEVARLERKKKLSLRDEADIERIHIKRRIKQECLTQFNAIIDARLK